MSEYVSQAIEHVKALEERVKYLEQEAKRKDAVIRELQGGNSSNNHNHNSTSGYSREKKEEIPLSLVARVAEEIAERLQTTEVQSRMRERVETEKSHANVDRSVMQGQGQSQGQGQGQDHAQTSEEGGSATSSATSSATEEASSNGDEDQKMEVRILVAGEEVEKVSAQCWANHGVDAERGSLELKRAASVLQSSTDLDVATKEAVSKSLSTLEDAQEVAVGKAVLGMARWEKLQHERDYLHDVQRELITSLQSLDSEAQQQYMQQVQATAGAIFKQKLSHAHSVEEMDRLVDALEPDERRSVMRMQALHQMVSGSQSGGGGHNHSHGGVPCDGHSHGHSHGNDHGHSHSHSHEASSSSSSSSSSSHSHSHDGVPCDGHSHGHSHGQSHTGDA